MFMAVTNFRILRTWSTFKWISCLSNIFLIYLIYSEWKMVKFPNFSPLFSFRLTNDQISLSLTNLFDYFTRLAKKNRCRAFARSQSKLHHDQSSWHNWQCLAVQYCITASPIKCRNSCCTCSTTPFLPRIIHLWQFLSTENIFYDSAHCWSACPSGSVNITCLRIVRFRPSSKLLVHLVSTFSVVT